MKFNDVISFIELRENVSKKNILAGLDAMTNINDVAQKYDFKHFLRFVVPYIPNYTNEQNKKLYDFFNNVYRRSMGYGPLKASKTYYDEKRFSDNEAAFDVLQQLSFVKAEDWDHQLPEDRAEKAVVNDLLKAYKRYYIAKTEDAEDISKGYFHVSALVPVGDREEVKRMEGRVDMPENSNRMQVLGAFISRYTRNVGLWVKRNERTYVVRYVAPRPPEGGKQQEFGF